MSGCALSISGEDAILIKYFQYFVYDKIREEDICVYVTHFYKNRGLRQYGAKYLYFVK